MKVKLQRRAINIFRLLTVIINQQEQKDSDSEEIDQPLVKLQSRLMILHIKHNQKQNKIVLNNSLKKTTKRQIQTTENEQTTKVDSKKLMTLKMLKTYSRA